MYKSLEHVSSDFTLYVLAMDDRCYEILVELNYKNLRPIRLVDFETEELLEVKKVRSFAEYCWTCSSSLIYYILNKYNPNHCTYIDADLYFYSNPSVLIDEMEEKNASVLIVGHRFNEYNKKQLSNKVGTYCVQFNTFKNNKNGLMLLDIWRKQCIEHCSCDGDGIHWADQKYMDNWIKDYNFVVETENFGAGIAPWNLAQYSYVNSDLENNIHVKRKNKDLSIIFYHFENIKYIENDIININVYNSWTIDRVLVNKLYIPYLKKLNETKCFLKEKFSIEIILKSHPGINSSKTSFSAKLKRKINHLTSMSALVSYIMTNIPQRLYKKYNIVDLKKEQNV